MSLPTIAIATPVYGGAELGQVPVMYMHALLSLTKDMTGVEPLEHFLFMNTDLVRARSKALHLAYAAGFDLLLFWDADIIAPAAQLRTCIEGMVRATAYADVVAVDYRARGGQHGWLARGKGDVVRRSTVRLREADYVPFGFCLITRACMQKMTEHCLERPGLRHREEIDGLETMIATSFMLTHTVGDVLLEECFSFCQRWRSIGGKCHLYEDAGHELGHLGGTVYR